jgi:hypothetical protein
MKEVAMNRFLSFLSVSISAVVVSAAEAQQYIMMPDSTNNRIVLFDPFDGSLVNGNYFGLAGGTPIHAMQVGDEIWVSEQLGDRVSRWDLGGASLGAITGQMDNLRGMARVGNTVYVCNDGTGNGAPGASLRMFDTSGADMGFFLTTSSSPFGILENQGSLLVSSDAANDDIHRYSFTGTPMGTFHNSTTLNFAEQMNYASDGSILVAGFSSNNIVRLDGVGGVITTYAASGARGVIQLGNGNIMWSNSGGAHVLNPNTGQDTLIVAGGGRFFDLVTIPGPGALALMGVAALLGSPRRRRMN